MEEEEDELEEVVFAMHHCNREEDVVDEAIERAKKSEDVDEAIKELKKLRREREMLRAQLGVAKESLQSSFAKVREYIDRQKRQREEEEEEEEEDKEEENLKKHRAVAEMDISE